MHPSEHIAKIAGAPAVAAAGFAGSWPAAAITLAAVVIIAAIPQRSQDKLALWTLLIRGRRAGRDGDHQE